MLIDNKVICKLNEIDLSLKDTISSDISNYEKKLELFETIQVHTGCGGCYGTQMCKGGGGREKDVLC